MSDARTMDDLEPALAIQSAEFSADLLAIIAALHEIVVEATGYTIEELSVFSGQRLAP